MTSEARLTSQKWGRLELRGGPARLKPAAAHDGHEVAEQDRCCHIDVNEDQLHEHLP